MQMTQIFEWELKIDGFKELCTEDKMTLIDVILRNIQSGCYEGSIGMEVEVDE